MTLCNEPVRDRTLVAPIATAVTGALAIAFVSLRVYEAWVKQEWQWADSCAVVALVGFPLFSTSQTGGDRLADRI